MKSLLPLAHAIDRFNNLFGRIAIWATFISCMVSAGNASIRYVLYGRSSGTRKAAIDLFGMIFFLMPAALLMVWMSWPWFLDSFIHNEMSSNAGGLVRWPVKLMVPLGFLMLSLQGISEIIKRVCFLQGTYEMNLQYERPLQ